ncbi:MAG TPA: hypothetical protein VGG62_12180 [Terracidiphilus sp.]|jgi:hypothetical protein
MSEELNALVWQMKQRKTAARIAARTDPATGKLAKTVSNNAYIRSKAIVVEPMISRRGAELWITYNGARGDFLRMRKEFAPTRASTFCDPDALNGYVAFPKRHAPRMPITTGGIVKYIPVHGGATWACKDATAAVWGFDTMHAGSENVERTNQDWIRYQCHVLHHGLEIAEELWPKFKRATQAQRAEMAQQLFDIDVAASGRTTDRLGFEAMLGILFGRIG